MFETSTLKCHMGAIFSISSPRSVSIGPGMRLSLTHADTLGLRSGIYTGRPHQSLRTLLEVGIPRGDKNLINIGRFRCFVAGKTKITCRNVAEQ